MTKEVAEKIVRGITDKIECNTTDIDDWVEFWGFTREDYEEFFDMAIKALEQEPCEDCVSRAEAMTEIQMNARKYSIAKEFGGMGQVEWSDYLISIKDALDILRNLPSVTPTQKWIPVSEGLPKEDGDYFVTVSTDIGAKNPVREVYKDYFCEFSEKWLYYGEDVTAWMPLPKPYKEEREEK